VGGPLQALQRLVPQAGRESLGSAQPYERDRNNLRLIKEKSQ